MIEAKTLFILGAGASVPYGLPTGQQLREHLCDLDGARGRSHTLELLINEYGYHEGAIKNFAEAFTRSGLNSIDAFLARRSDFEKIGKAAIAAALFSFEQEWRLNAAGGAPGRSDWYGELWNRMMDYVEGPQQLVEGNHVRFATFNYDRSLEAFLHRSVRATFDMDDEKAFAVWSQFPIHHIYGSIGQFGPANGFTYGLDPNAQSKSKALTDALGSVKVVPAARQEEQDAFVIDGATWADRVVILGFSFDPHNCHRLGLAGVAQQRTKGSLVPKVFATSLGMTEVEGVVARRRLLVKMASVDAGWRMVAYDSLNSLREWGLLLQ